MRIEPSRFIAASFVRKDGRYYDINRLSALLSREDVQRVCLHMLKENFPDITLTSELLRAVFKLVIEANHTDFEQTIPVWSGQSSCRPESSSRLMHANGMATINTWSRPAYRSLGETKQDLGPLIELLSWMMPRDEDRTMFLSWLAWNLQNEGDKPNWAPFLYSGEKGTGKSTLCQLIVQLFGQENSFTQNSVSKLTGRFNLQILQSKLVVCEEVQLTAGSTQGNTLKTYITESETTAEAKGRDIERVRQCCAFLFTLTLPPPPNPV